MSRSLALPLLALLALPVASCGGCGLPAASNATGGENGAAGATAAGAPGAGASGEAGAAGASAAAEGGSSGAACEYKDDKQFCACLARNCGGDTLPDKNGVFHTVYCGNCGTGEICVGQPTFAGGAAGTCAHIGGLTPPQKKTAEQLTSIWENSTPNIAYAYSKDIGDGRGYTSGRAGFCTGTGDAIVVVACYHAAKPGNILEKYLPALTTIQQRFVASKGTKNQPDKTGLAGWASAWKTAAADPAFRACQDAVVDAVYYGAAMQHAARKKLTTALTKAAFYDAQINMGDDNPSYGMKAMIAKTDALVPLPANPTREDESKWLAAFLKIRAQIMFHDDQAWRENMYRVAHYEKLRREGNFDLAGCVHTGRTSANALWPGLGFTSERGDVFTVCNQ